MSNRHLIPVPDVEDLLNEGLRQEIAFVMAEHIITGRTIYNIETETLVDRDVATPEDIEQASKAFARYLLSRDEAPK